MRAGDYGDFTLYSSDYCTTEDWVIGSRADMDHILSRLLRDPMLESLWLRVETLDDPREGSRHVLRGYMSALSTQPDLTLCHSNSKAVGKGDVIEPDGNLRSTRGTP